MRWRRTIRMWRPTMRSGFRRSSKADTTRRSRSTTLLPFVTRSPGIGAHSRRRRPTTNGMTRGRAGTPRRRWRGGRVEEARALRDELVKASRVAVPVETRVMHARLACGDFDGALEAGGADGGGSVARDLPARRRTLDRSAAADAALFGAARSHRTARAVLTQGVPKADTYTGRGILVRHCTASR